MAETINKGEEKKLKESWIEHFENEGEKSIAKTLEQIDITNVTDQERFQELKNAASSTKAQSYLETMKDEAIRELGLERANFDIDKYSDLPKTEIAQEMADYAVNSLGIKPVYGGEQQDDVNLFQYNPENGLWEYFSEPRIGRLGKKMAKRQWTRHTKSEFTTHLINHPNYMRLKDIGTPPEWLPLSNGKKLYLGDLSDISNLELKDINREDHAMNSLNTEYDPEAECPQWEQLVEDLLAGKEEQIKTLQEYLGWTLKFPDRSFKKALIILGVSNSGKSQVAEVLEQLWEKDSGKSISNLTMPQIGFRRAFHIDKLEGAVMNIDKDLSGQEIDDTAKIKSVLAQEKINVEPKGQDSFVIQPQAKHFIASNVAPNIENKDDEAFYQRFLTLKAPNAVPREDRIKDLGRKIYEEEASGVLNWMLEGLKRLEEQGDFTHNPEAHETMISWMEFGDSAYRFIWQCCDLESDPQEEQVPKDRLYELYRDWADKNLTMESSYSNSSFKKTVSEHPKILEDRTRVNGVRQRVYMGLSVDTSEIYDTAEELEDARHKEEPE